MLPLLLILVFSSYLPSLKIAYFGEDIGSHLPEAAGPFCIGQLWHLHHEHFIPLIKLIYRLCYHTFWMDPMPFHLILIAIQCFCFFILYKLLLALSDSRESAFLGAMLFGLSNVYDDAVVNMSNAQTLFCLSFSLCFLYSIYKYFETKEAKWRIRGIVCGFFATCTFALGVLMGFWGIFFYYCCVPHTKGFSVKKDILDLFLILQGWLIGCVLYFFHFQDIVFPVYSLKITNTAFHLYSLAIGAVALRNIWNPLITYILPVGFISWFMFACLLGILFWHRHILAEQKIKFFMIWTIGHYFFIGWSRQIIEAIDVGQRHNLFPAVGISCVYALAFSSLQPWFSSRVKAISTGYKRYVVYILATLLLISLAYIKWKTVDTAYAKREKWVTFCQGFRLSIENYRELNPGKKIKLANKKVFFKENFISPQSLKSLSEFVLPGNLRNSVEWDKTTDAVFLDFLKANYQKYEIFFKILEGDGQFTEKKVLLFKS